jgi:thiol:disulfide interchange protein DsbD
MKIIRLLLVLFLLAGVTSPSVAETDAAPARPAANVLDLGFGAGEREFLDPEAAFVLTLEVKDADTLLAQWNIAEGYYLYRDKFKFSVDNKDVKLGKIEIPAGQKQEDPTFGQVEIHTGTLAVPIPLLRAAKGAMPIALKFGYQGCAEAGICYPPIEKTLSVDLPGATVTMLRPAVATSAVAPTPGDSSLAADDRLARQLATQSPLITLLSFLGLGILLSLTPCVLPMAPILSGIIIGRGDAISVRNAFILSLVFVLAMAVTYAVIGVIAGLFGQNLQAVFQNKWVLISFASIFVVLAFSMFGFFKIQLPSS